MALPTVSNYKRLINSSSLKAFYDDIVYHEIAGDRNRFFVTFMKGLYSTQNNKQESIGTMEIHAPQVNNITSSANSFASNREGARYDAFLHEQEITNGTPSEPNNGFVPITELRGTRFFQTTITASTFVTRSFNYEMFDGTTHSASAHVVASYFYPFSSHQLSVLRDEPTIIVNLKKESECFNGIGEKGFVVVPEQTHQKVRDNLEYYLEKAGLIDKTVRNKAPEKGI